MAEFFSHVLTIVVMSAFLAAFPLVFSVFFRYMRALAEKTETQLDDQILAVIEQAVQIAVLAAEQMAISEQIRSSANAKKEYAIHAATKTLKDLGLKNISVEVISSTVEAAVYRLLGAGSPESDAQLYNLPSSGGTVTALFVDADELPPSLADDLAYLLEKYGVSANLHENTTHLVFQNLSKGA